MINFRKAMINDMKLYFDWANDPSVREQSYHSDVIDFENHKIWFESKLKDTSVELLIFQNEENFNIGQVRIQKQNKKEALIGISIAIEHRGNGYAKEMLELSSNYFLEMNQEYQINAFIKENNLSSKYAFEKAGFEFKEIVIYENFRSFHYIKFKK